MRDPVRWEGSEPCALDCRSGGPGQKLPQCSGLLLAPTALRKPCWLPGDMDGAPHGTSGHFEDWNLLLSRIAPDLCLLVVSSLCVEGVT